MSESKLIEIHYRGMSLQNTVPQNIKYYDDAATVPVIIGQDQQGHTYVMPMRWKDILILRNGINKVLKKKVQDKLGTLISGEEK